MTNDRRWGRTAPWLAGAALVVLVGNTVIFKTGLLALDESEDEGLFFVVVLTLALLGWGGAGFLIGRKQPENAVGLVLAAEALLIALASLGSGLTGPSSDSFLASGFEFVFGQLSLVPLLLAVPLLLLLFPTGRPPSSKWNLVGWAMAIGAAASVVGFAISPSHNPAGGLPTLSWLVTVLLVFAGFAGVGSAVLAIASVVVRFRRSRGEERAQLRWLASVALLGGVFLAGLLVSAFLAPPGGENLGTTLFFNLLLATAAIGLPVAIGVAILKYRLYDIDLVIRKTVIYGALAGFITVVYTAIVVVFGAFTTESLLPSIVATAVVAGLFQPVRGWATRLANRLVFGKRAEPYEVLARFSDRVGETYAADDVLPRMAHVIADGTGAEWAAVWTQVGDELRPAAVWPSQDTTPELDAADRAVEVNHQGEVLGALAAKKPAGEPLTPTEEKLLEDIASQAGLVLRNLGLAAELRARIDELSARSEELRASRVRIVQAHDAERRRLERNIHDGAQQHLVALAVKLRLAKDRAAKNPVGAAEILRDLRDQTDLALATLLDLASGIYPATLEERGIAAALEEQGGSIGAPVTIDADGLERLPIETEAAVYFCCLEAMQNAAKHARASHVNVRIACDEGRLSFSVGDDGAGFDPALARSGSGMRNMHDRLAAFGGHVEIASQPDVGTTVRGHLPLREEVAV